jgi:hypothetical protein
MRKEILIMERSLCVVMPGALQSINSISSVSGTWLRASQMSSDSGGGDTGETSGAVPLQQSHSRQQGIFD